MLYNINIKECDFKDEYHVMEDGRINEAYWVDIDEFKSSKKTLYPEQIFKYL